MKPDRRAGESVSGEVAAGSPVVVHKRRYFHREPDGSFTPALNLPDPAALVAELRSARCRCGFPKVPARTFCGPCYWALPRGLQKGLYKKLGRGYETAYAGAAAYLDANIRGPL